MQLIPRNKLGQVRMFAVAGVEDGTTLTLYASNGLKLATVNSDRIGMIDEALLSGLREELLAQQDPWYLCAKKLVGRIESRAGPYRATAWERKASSMASSCALRRRESRRTIHARRKFDAYNTPTWRQAAERMVMQGINRWRVRARSGWERFAYTVANNAQKRAVRRHP